MLATFVAGPGSLLGLVAAAGAPGGGIGRHARRRRERRAPRQSVGDQLDLGDRRRLPRDVHAGRLRVPRDRLLARQERGHGGREDPHELLDRRALYWAVGFAFAFGDRRASSARTGSSCATTATRRRRSRSWACPTRRSSRSGSSSSSSAPSRWRSCGARRSSGSSSASTSSTRSSSPAVIYPIASHWVFGGGWLQANLGMQDFAGSTAVHLIGATGALAVLLLLGPRRGKYGKDGKPRAIPGHNMPLFGLGMLILWLGWFGFNPGSTLNALDGRFPEVLLVTQLAAAAGVLDARSPPRTGRRRRSTSAWPATARSPRSSPSRRPSGYVEPWAAPIIGARRRRDRRRSASTRSTSGSTTRSARSRRTAWPASGARSPAASSPRRGWPQYNAVRRRRACLHRLASPARRPGARRRGRVRVRLRALLRHVLGDQEDLRPARHGRGRGRRAGHLRARHVRLPGAVHPGARAHRLRRAPRGSRDIRGRAAPAHAGGPGTEEDRGVHPPRGVRADPDGAARASGSPRSRSRRSRGRAARRASPSATAAPS